MQKPYRKKKHTFIVIIYSVTQLPLKTYLEERRKEPYKKFSIPGHTYMLCHVKERRPKNDTLNLQTGVVDQERV